MGSNSILIAKRKIVLFDSSCLLCSKTVQILLKIDKKQILTFASLSSKLGTEITSNIDLKVASVVFSNQGKISVKSNALLNVCWQLGFPYNVLSIFYIIPEFLRNGVYDLIAKHRVSWFGKTNKCIINNKEMEHRIIL